MRKVKCQLNEPPFYQCCCVCESQRKVLDEVSDKFKGKYVCTIFFEMAKDDEEKPVLECSKHSCGCEMWHDIRKG